MTSTGTGIAHSEYNRNPTTPVHFLQVSRSSFVVVMSLTCVADLGTAENERTQAVVLQSVSDHDSPTISMTESIVVNLGNSRTRRR